MNFYGTGNRPSIMCWVAPRLRAPLARLSSNARVSPRFCRCRARHAPDRPRPALRGSSSPPAVHRAETTTFRRDDDPHARFRRRRRPRQLPARVPARHARLARLITRARARKSRTKRCDPPRAPPSRRDVLFLFLGVCRPREIARAAIRGARAPSFPSLPFLTPSPSAIPPPVPRARRSSPGLRVAPRRHVRVSPPLRRRVIRPVPSPRLRPPGSRRRRPPPPPRTGTRPDDDRPHHRRRDGFGFSDKFWFSDSTPRETVRGGVLRALAAFLLAWSRAARVARDALAQSGTIRTRTRKRRQGAQIGADGSRGAPPRPRGG